jgi:hypothetical protein
MLKKCKNIFFMGTLLFTSYASAAPLNGSATFVGASPGLPITGDIEVARKTMSVSEWMFFGAPTITKAVEILEPGSYTRIAGDVVVPAGHVGAHVQVQWSVNTYYTYMVWNVTTSGSVATFTIIDSDNDGTPGHTLNNGPFPGQTIYYEFTTSPTGPNDPRDPDINLSLAIDGGTNHECTADSSANVSATATPFLVGEAELDSIFWTIDNEDAGTGSSISENLSLGAHFIEVTALTTTGQSDTKSTTIMVRDTIRPVVKVAFLDRRGNEIDSAAKGRVEISIKITDDCDPEPVITSSTAVPSTQVADGDMLRVSSNLNNLKLRTSALRVTASGKDASGNFSMTNSDSSKTLILE